LFFDVSISLVSQKLLPFEKLCFSHTFLSQGITQNHWLLLQCHDLFSNLDNFYIKVCKTI